MEWIEAVLRILGRFGRFFLFPNAHAYQAPMVTAAISVLKKTTQKNSDVLYQRTHRVASEASETSEAGQMAIMIDGGTVCSAFRGHISLDKKAIGSSRVRPLTIGDQSRDAIIPHNN